MGLRSPLVVDVNNRTWIVNHDQKINLEDDFPERGAERENGIRGHSIWASNVLQIKRIGVLLNYLFS